MVSTVSLYYGSNTMFVILYLNIRSAESGINGFILFYMIERVFSSLRTIILASKY